MTSSAVIPGSFDPITNGHLNIIERAASLYDEVIVAVLLNRDKQSLLDLDTRLGFVEECIKDWPTVRTEKFEGLLVDYVRANHIGVVVRGLRGSRDFEYELQMARMNRAIGPIETVFIPADPEFAHVSSSMVKQVAALQGTIQGLVPPSVCAHLVDLYKEDPPHGH